MKLQKYFYRRLKELILSPSIFFFFFFYSVNKVIIPINGVFVPLDGVPSCGGHAVVGVGGLGVLVWRVLTSSGSCSQVHSLQRAGSSGMVVVMVVWVSVHPTHPLQPIVGQVFILKHKDKSCVTFDLLSCPVDVQ